MPRKVWVRAGMSDNVSLDPIGTFSFPKRVMERLGWIVPSRVRVEYLVDKKHAEVPPTIFFSIYEDGNEQGYSLSLLYRRKHGDGGSGGKVRCVSLAKTVIAPRVALPIIDIVPIYPATNLCDVILMLSDPTWTYVDFTMAGVQSVQSSQLGVYQILDDDDKPLKIGQGNVSMRLLQHLKDDRFVRSGKLARFFPVSEKKNAVVLEQVFIAQHENVHHKLPELNSIRA